MAELQVGKTEKFAGNVTTLEWIRIGSEAATEANLGYQAGRLSRGYHLLLLKQRLTPKDFQFDGTTMRSGGKLGLPGGKAADDVRPLVHDQILAERGRAGYEAYQQTTLGAVAISGAKRIAKVLPVTRHDNDLDPGVQYPMGGGGLQWKLITECAFLVALHVAADGTARTPDFTVNLRTCGYDDRARIWRYLVTA